MPSAEPKDVRAQSRGDRDVMRKSARNKAKGVALPKAWAHPDPLGFLTQLVKATSETYKVQHLLEIQGLVKALESRNCGLAVEYAGSISRQMYGDAPFLQAYGANQCAALVSKVPFKDPNLLPGEAAMKKFFAAERRCMRTNQRLTAMKRARRHRYLSIRAQARAFIEHVLGDSPPLAAIYDRCDFGPGATVGVHGEATHAMAKLHSPEWSCTPSCIDYAYGALLNNQHFWHVTVENNYHLHTAVCLDPEELWAEVRSRVLFVDHNKITLVPKTATTDRTVAMEPLLNSFVQKGVDDWMRDRLRKVGVTLRSQEYNQRLARLGSLGVFNPFVTLDLEAASDSIAIETVRDLLPPAWFEFLTCLRSPRYLLPDGTSARYEKFCSMGNGFCFPLESLIFAALVYSVGVETGDVGPGRPRVGIRPWTSVDEDWSLVGQAAVYGDDIIVRQSSALYLTEVLKFYGFRLNLTKSFIVGRFRESCGADFFEGVGVRPYYLRELPLTEGSFYKLGNALLESPFPSTFLWELVFDQVPWAVRKVRPYPGNPETAFTASLDTFLTSKWCRWDRAEQRWSWLELQTKAIPDERRASSAVQMYGLLSGATPASARGENGGYPTFSLRRRTRTVLKDLRSRRTHSIRKSDKQG